LLLTSFRSREFGFCSRRSDVSRKSFHPCSTELRALLLELQQARMEAPIRGGLPKFPHILSTSAATVVFCLVSSTYSDSICCLRVRLKMLQRTCSQSLVQHLGYDPGLTPSFRKNRIWTLRCRRDADGLVHITDVRRLDVPSISDGTEYRAAVMLMRRQKFQIRVRRD